MKDSRLGKQGEDKVSGFKGTITCVAVYLTGCTQLGLSPRVNADGKILSSEWFDEGRVIISSENGISPEEVKSKENGGPNRDAPRI